MNDTPVQPATRTSRGTASRLINLAGVILLIVAAALYWRDMQVNKEKAAAAGMVRLNATTPMIAMGLMLDSTGAAQNILIGCPRDIATNIISKLAQAEATDFPSGTVEGDEYKIYLMFTNRTMAVMRAVRLYDSPSNLYVGMQIPAEFDENKTPVSWVYTRPALVPDLGNLFKDMADRHVPELQKNAAQYQAGLTNLATRLAEVSTAADAATNATVEAWFNETNAPAAAPEAPAPKAPASSLDASPPQLATPPEAAAAE